MLTFPRIPDVRGSLSVIEGARHVPFDIKRVFYVYGIPGGADRGAHAHNVLEQVLVCLAGSVDVQLDDGRATRVVTLTNPWEGLYIPPMVWASETNMLPGTVYMVLASAHYDEADYYRNYEEFLRVARGNRE